ncbi:MAG: MMPL family transporter [Lewinellaceae bacterium]|nr:MMPL family transporter [Saprospiraceae bacterium]MCB9337797.1 MMPL family transporter [Lewinellaceae bacterium]
MANIFTGIYIFFENRRGLLALLVLLCVAVIGFLAFQIKLEEDITKALPDNEKTARFNDIFQNSKFLEKLIVTVSQKDTTAPADPDRLVEYTEALVERLDSTVGQYIASMQVRVDDEVALQLFDYMHEHLPSFLEEEDYKLIDTLTAPENIPGKLEDDLRTLSSPAGLIMKRLIPRDPLGLTWLGMKKYQDFQYDENYELYDGYVMTRDGRNLLLFILPSNPTAETINNRKLIEGMEQAIQAQTADGFEDVGTTFFGSTAVAVGNAVQLRKDAELTLTITIILLLAAIWVFFRNLRAPLLMILPVLFGGGFALACFYLLKGSISIIALGTGSVVFGIALNYSIHFFTHFRNHPNVREVIAEMAEPMTIGSLTTIGAFFCLQFVNSQILRDLGLFAGFSLIGTALFTLIVLPHLVRTPKTEPTADGLPRATILTRLGKWRPDKSKYVVRALMLLTPVMLFFARKVSFDSDMNNLNFMPPSLIASQEKLNQLNAFAMQSVYAVSVGSTLEEALRNNENLTPVLEKMKADSLIRKYSGVSTFLLSDSLQRLRIERWNNYWTPEKKKEVISHLLADGQALGFKASAFRPFMVMLEKDFQPADSADVQRFKDLFLADYVNERPGQVGVVTMMKAEREKNSAIYRRLETMPHTSVIDKTYLTELFVGLVQDDFNKIAIYSSVLVFVALLLIYGRIELAFITFLPMAVSWVWILGLMSLLGIQFNIVNVILSALIFGLGDDFAIFVMEGMQREYKTGQKSLPVIRASIVISAIATIIGLGVLILAKHPAIRSLAVVSVVGIVCVVFMSNILEPFLFNYFIKNRVDKGRPPWTLPKFVSSSYAFGYFGLGSILLSGIGLLFLKWLPIGRRRVKYVYHWMMSKMAGSVIYMMFNVKKTIFNPENKDFSKPAIIIANHSSVLDILSTVMLHPKVLLLTNKWVWESPFFGKVVQLADYYPVGEGVDNVERLRERVKEGYSIVVFPEGTRSTDGKIGRFHKGAFYLAEQFQLDILPLVFHGCHYSVSKGDFMVKNGEINMKWLPRISPDDKSFGEGYAERTKRISRYFKQEYAKLKAERETPAYHRERLLANYLYKGPVLEWYARIKTAMEKNYSPFHQLVPLRGKILDIGCGYGFMDYMLYFLSEEREITGIDYDEEKVATANHCYSKTDKINFIHGSAVEMAFENYDCFILSDVLHYLQPTEQESLLRKCFTNLNPGGVAVIRDGDKDLAERQKGTWWTEYFSTRFCQFNKVTEHGLSFMSGRTIEAIAGEFGMQVERIDQTKFTSNVIFVVRK